MPCTHRTWGEQPVSVDTMRTPLEAWERKKKGEYPAEVPVIPLIATSTGVWGAEATGEMRRIARNVYARHPAWGIVLQCVFGHAGGSV